MFINMKGFSKMLTKTFGSKSLIKFSHLDLNSEGSMNWLEVLFWFFLCSARFSCAYFSAFSNFKISNLSLLSSLSNCAYSTPFKQVNSLSVYTCLSVHFIPIFSSLPVLSMIPLILFEILFSQLTSRCWPAPVFPSYN